MARYTLPSGIAKDIITFSNPRVDKDLDVLSCDMSFHSESNRHTLVMQAFPLDVENFDGGLVLIFGGTTLKLDLTLSCAWADYVVTAKLGSDTVGKTLAPRNTEFTVTANSIIHISVAKGSTTWDPKIKVIPPPP